MSRNASFDETDEFSNSSVPPSQEFESGSSFSTKPNSSIADKMHNEFASYLEEIGFIKALTQVVVELYEEPEKPGDPIEYFLNRLSSDVPTRDSLLAAKAQIDQFEKELSTLTTENNFLRQKLNHHEQLPENFDIGLVSDLDETGMTRNEVTNDEYEEDEFSDECEEKLCSVRNKSSQTALDFNSNRDKI